MAVVETEAAAALAEVAARVVNTKTTRVKVALAETVATADLAVTAAAAAAGHLSVSFAHLRRR